eukprot:7285790-Alexandrium_andersonii.AAC.1
MEAKTATSPKARRQPHRGPVSEHTSDLLLIPSTFPFKYPGAPGCVPPHDIAQSSDRALTRSCLLYTSPSPRD